MTEDPRAMDDVDLYDDLSEDDTPRKKSTTTTKESGGTSTSPPLNGSAQSGVVSTSTGSAIPIDEYKGGDITFYDSGPYIPDSKDAPDASDITYYDSGPYIPDEARNVLKDDVHLSDTESASDDDDVVLDVSMSASGATVARAPKRHARAVRKQTEMLKREIKLFVSAPPELHDARESQNPATCTVVVAKMAWGVTDVDLRRHAESFGSVRLVRFLEHASAGVSTGLAAVQYLTEDAARRALTKVTGLSELPAWSSYGCVPILNSVSEDVYNMMSDGDLSWFDGGSCPDKLRVYLEKIGGLDCTTRR